MHKLRDAHGETEADLKSQLEEMAGRGKVYVLGLGNTDRADDGAGIEVAEALKRLFPSFAFSEHDGVEGIVLDLSERDEDLMVFFVDAANIDNVPGSIKLISREHIRETEITTHRVMVGLMASMLDDRGKKSAVIGIQPERIEFQGEVSQGVREAIDLVTSVLEQIMRRNDRPARNHTRQRT